MIYNRTINKAFSGGGWNRNDALADGYMCKNNPTKYFRRMDYELWITHNNEILNNSEMWCDDNICLGNYGSAKFKTLFPIQCFKNSDNGPMSVIIEKNTTVHIKDAEILDNREAVTFGGRRDPIYKCFLSDQVKFAPLSLTLPHREIN